MDISLKIVMYKDMACELRFEIEASPTLVLD